jgi:hypothetical protein
MLGPKIHWCDHNLGHLVLECEFVSKEKSDNGINLKQNICLSKIFLADRH